MTYDNRRRGSGRDSFNKRERGMGSDFERSSDRYDGGYGGGGGGFGGGGYGGGGGGGGFGGGRGGFGAGRGGGGGRDMNPGTAIGTATGTVKFFNAAKGFGFIVRDDGGEDVFVHISAVEQAGLEGLADGQPLTFTLFERNGRVSATNLMIEGEPLPVTASPREGDARGPRAGGAGRSQASTDRYEGTVKFFNTTKGFGFIAREDGGPDAFVHISAVERAGLGTLSEGQRVSFQLELDRRGKQAATNLQTA